MIRPAPVAPPEALALSATEIAAGVNAGELDPAALIRACMEEIEASYDLFAVLARGYAAAIKRARQGVRGPLAGVPMLVSDTLDTAGLTTTLGSWIYRDRIPERSAAAVERLEQAGAIVIGKANVDEFGWGVTGENPHWGFAANPLRPDLVSGGACGGAAAGLAARVCALALGSDADGGLRVPAACCGTVAFKPASGRVERRGSLPLAPSFRRDWTDGSERSRLCSGVFRARGRAGGFGRACRESASGCSERCRLSAAWSRSGQSSRRSIYHGRGLGCFQPFCSNVACPACPTTGIVNNKDD